MDLLVSFLLWIICGAVTSRLYSLMTAKFKEAQASQKAIKDKGNETLYRKLEDLEKQIVSKDKTDHPYN